MSGTLPVCAHFCKGFLGGQTFCVHCGATLSKQAKEHCGVPQGAASSLILFLTCVEAMLHPRRIAVPCVQSPACRLCFCPIETTLHIMTTCSGTSPCRAAHSISLEMLADDTQANLLAIACFDSFSAHHLPFNQCSQNQLMLDNSLTSVLDLRKCKLVQTSL